VVFGKQAESCGRYLAKGRQAAVQGRIQTGSYKNKEGQTVYTTDIAADRVEFLGGKDSAARSQGRPSPGMDERNAAFDDLPDSFSAAEDDIPF